MMAHGEETTYLRERTRGLGLADSAVDLSQRTEEMLSRPGAVARLADEVEIAVVGKTLRWYTEAQHLASDSTIPTPREEGERGIVGEKRQLTGSDEDALHRKPKLAESVLSRRTILNEHALSLLRPESRKETKVVTQVTACVRCGKIIEVGSKRKVMLRIKNVYSHK